MNDTQIDFISFCLVISFIVGIIMLILYIRMITDIHDIARYARKKEFEDKRHKEENK